MKNADRNLMTADKSLPPLTLGRKENTVALGLPAPDCETVHSFYKAALAAGGRGSNGAPGERPYHPGYYGAFVLDPYGNNIEAVFHGAFERSAPSVVITPK